MPSETYSIILFAVAISLCVLSLFVYETNYGGLAGISALVISIILVQISITDTHPFSDEVRIYGYHCPIPSDNLHNCPVDKRAFLSLTFVAYPNQQNVIGSVKEPHLVNNLKKFSDCNVFDNKNWECKISDYKKLKMNDGLLSGLETNSDANKNEGGDRLTKETNGLIFGGNFFKFIPYHEWLFGKLDVMLYKQSTKTSQM